MWAYDVKMKGFLRQLARSNKRTFSGIIKHANKKDFQRLINFTFDILRKCVKVSPQLARLIKQHRHELRHIVHPFYSLGSKKRYMIQKGGGKFGSAMKTIGSTMRTAATS